MTFKSTWAGARYQNPLLFLFTVILAAILWNRLSYGVDWTQESSLLLGSSWTTQYRNFWGDEEGIFLAFRHLTAAGALVSLLVGTFFFYRLGEGFWALLSTGILLGLLPEGVVGPHPLILTGMAWSLFLWAAWSWLKMPRYWLSWLLPWLALLVFVLLPQMLPLLGLGLMGCLLRRPQEGDPRFLRLHLLAHLNIVLILIFLVFLEPGWILPLLHESFANVWNGQGLGSGPESHLLLLLSVLGLSMGFLCPARVFHRAFAALVLISTVLIFSGMRLYFAAVGPGSSLFLVVAPAFLAQLDRQARSEGGDRQLRKFLLFGLFGVALMGLYQGPAGAVMVLIPFLALVMSSGFRRGVRRDLFFSGLSFSFGLVLSLYTQFPPGQPPSESLDQIETGAFRGLRTTRVEFRQMQELENDLQSAPGGAETLWVAGNRVGAYWLAPQEKSEWADFSIGDGDHFRQLLSEDESTPDLILEFPRDPSFWGGLLDQTSIYQVWRETAGYRIFAKKALVESEMRSN